MPTFPVRSALRAPAMLALVAGSMLSTLAAPASAVISSGTNGFNGIWINQVVGATRYYANGYTGSRATMANIEAGHIWNGHESLTHLNTYLNGAGVASAPTPTWPANTPNFDFHATMVGFTMNGRQTAGVPGDVNDQYQGGIAPGARLVSGAVATAFSSPGNFTGSFSTSFNSTLPVYNALLRSNTLNIPVADVTNSSWGGYSTNPITTSFSSRILALDTILYDSGKLSVFSAGNNGPNPNTVGDPGASKNGLAVGAMTGETGNPAYDTVASFSSRSPSDFILPTTPTNGTRISGVLASVDIVAPGDTLTLAAYLGKSGGNFGASSNDLRNNLYFTGNAGTSFSAPIVAAGAALMVDAARDKGYTNGRDGRVLRALLMNSASKNAGWTNNTTNVAGVLRTTQGIDWTTGAGKLNLNRGYDQQNSGTTDVAGLGGGIVKDLGWDFGNVANGAPNDYSFMTPLIAGNTFTATLTWWAKEQFNLTTLASSSVGAGAQDQLILELWRQDILGNVLVADSVSQYNLTQHINITVPVSGNYFMRVKWNQNIYNFIAKAQNETYGLAWSIPAPGTGVLAAFGLMAFGRRRR